MKENFFRAIGSEAQPNLEEKKDLAEEKPASSIFALGEVFDSVAELNKLKDFHGAEGLEKISEFKEKLKTQKEGIANMQEDILRYVEDNQDYNITSLLSLALAEGKKYALSLEQEGKVFDTIRKMDRKIRGIKEVLSTYLEENGEISGPKLYEKIFGAAPKGEVRVIVNPISIYLRLSSLDDYAYLISNAYKKHRELEPYDYVLAKRMGGAKLEKVPDKRVRDAVIVENPMFFNRDDYSSDILTHERQHVINGFIHEVHLPDFENGLKRYKQLQKEGKFTDDNQSEEEFLRLVVENPKIESRIKDEICAYFKDGSRPKFISKSLLQRGNIYDYGLDYDYNLHDDDSDLPLEYMELVEDGIIAFSELIKSGYSIDQAVSILYTEPLLKWPKVLERMTEKKIDDEYWERKRKKYISQKVFADMKAIKEEEDGD